MNSTERSRVLYFTLVPLAGPSGGFIVCREHVERLNADPKIELVVSILMHDEDGSTYLNSRGIKHRLLKFEKDRGFYREKFLKKLDPSKRWPFPLEIMRSPITDFEFRLLVEKFVPDVIVIDYLYSALLVPSAYFGKSRVATITLNRETEFFKEQCELKINIPDGASCSRLALHRLARFEREVHKRSDVVVVLSSNDLLSHSNGKDPNSTVISPLLNESPRRWQDKQSARLFYVGSLDHYPNFLGLQWLAEKFAPILERDAPTAQIDIIGPAEDEVEPTWIRGNINFLGRCDKETVSEHFLGCSLFIVPIQNNFGSKIKVLECVSHGTPLIATEGALSGIPFRDSIPQFDLADPEGAVKLAVDIMASKENLIRVSENINKNSRLMEGDVRELWGKLISRLHKQPERQPAAIKITSPLFQWRNPMQSYNQSSSVMNWPSKFEICTQTVPGINIIDMYPLETLEDKRVVRWTTFDCEIRVKLNQKFLPKFMRLKLVEIPYPDQGGFLIKANGQEILKSNSANRTKIFGANLPALTDVEELVISVITPERKFPGDSRNLGILIEALTLERPSLLPYISFSFTRWIRPPTSKLWGGERSSKFARKLFPIS